MFSVQCSVFSVQVPDVEHSGVTNMKALVANAALLIALFCVGCSTIEFSSNQPSTCEVHGAAMSKRRVRLEAAVPPGERDEPRYQLFPHADDPFRVRTCGLTTERYGRAFVCSQCIQAREKWLAAHGDTQVASVNRPLQGTQVISPATLSTPGAPRH